MKALFYDLETTGLPKQGDDPLLQPGIIEIAACLVDLETWEITDEFSQPVNPELPFERWEAGAIKAHGIQPQDRGGANSFFTVGMDFAKFTVGGHYFCGYNHIAFDNRILDWQLRRYGLEHNFPWPPVHVDIMLVAKRAGGYTGQRGAKAPKLVELYKDLSGKPLVGAHGALADTRATVFCAEKIARGEFP